jgi:hypothetical protein
MNISPERAAQISAQRSVIADRSNADTRERLNECFQRTRAHRVARGAGFRTLGKICIVPTVAAFPLSQLAEACGFEPCAPPELATKYPMFGCVPGRTALVTLPASRA